MDFIQHCEEESDIVSTLCAYVAPRFHIIISLFRFRQNSYIQIDIFFCNILLKILVCLAITQTASKWHLMPRLQTDGVDLHSAIITIHPGPYCSRKTNVERSSPEAPFETELSRHLPGFSLTNPPWMMEGDLIGWCGNGKDLNSGCFGQPKHIYRRWDN